MERILSDLRTAVRAEAWHSALALALALPDICGFVEEPNSGSCARYAAWFDRELRQRYTRIHDGVAQTFLNGHDCYALRCAFLHQGDFDVTDQRARQALESFRFVVPRPGLTVHNNLSGRALQLQVSIFCEDVCQAVERWLARARINPHLSHRLANLATVEIWASDDPIHL